MSTEHPLRPIMRDWLPEVDFGVLRHGYADHGRDYVLVLQRAGTYELTLTHVVQLHVETRVGDDVWARSWDDAFKNYAAWEAAGQPDGYVWGVKWSLAYPGLEAPETHPDASNWSDRLKRPMHFVAIETDLFRLTAVFHGASARKLSDDNALIDQALIPLKPPH